jgi:hypothetical protein
MKTKNLFTLLSLSLTIYSASAAAQISTGSVLVCSAGSRTIPAVCDHCVHDPLIIATHWNASLDSQGAVSTAQQIQLGTHFVTVTASVSSVQVEVPVPGDGNLPGSSQFQARHQVVLHVQDDGSGFFTQAMAYDDASAAVGFDKQFSLNVDCRVEPLE